MKLLPLVIRNALRNKRRTVLTIGSLMASLFIFVLLRTLITSWSDSSDVPESARRVIVQHRVSLANVLPEKHAEKIRPIAGVEVVHPYHWVGGVVKDREKEFFQQLACDTDTFFATWSEVKVTPEVRDAWLADRTGAIVGKKLLDKFGWKPGARFHLRSAIYTCDLDLMCIGTYEGYADDETVWLHRRALQEAVRGSYFEGMTGTFAVRCKSAELIPSVIAAIDREFESSDAPTRSMTEKDFIQSFVSMMGNVKGFFMSLAAAVLAAMLLIIVNTMSMAVRERTREIAVMKALGFTPSSIIFLVVTESVATCLVGGVLGCVGSRILFDNVLHRPSIGGMFPNFYPTWETVIVGLGIAGAMGFIAGLMPALRAARLEVVSGLRRVG